MRKLKIFIIANDTTYTYNLRNEIIEQLSDMGHEVVVLTRLLLLQDELKSLGCRLIDLDINRNGIDPLADLSLLRKILKLIRKEKPDVVLSYNIKPNVYGGIACRITKTPYVPNITGLGTPVEQEGPIQKIAIALYRAGVSAADCVMFQNEANRRFFIDHHMIRKGGRTRLLPGSGVSLKLHKPIPYPKDQGQVNFLFIARVLKEKGIDIYLNAAHRIYDKYRDQEIKFHICGQCDDEKYLDILKEAEQIGYIAYHGEQKDMIPFFAMANCIVHPSYYPEGMSNVLLEAAAHARPIIATDRAGCRETVDDGITGFVIPIRNENALVDALDRFMALSWDQKRDMGLAGRTKIEKEFDRQLVVKAYLEEINRIIGG